MTRSAIRENIFKLLFRVEFNDINDMPEQVRLFFEDDIEDEEVPAVGAKIKDKDASYIKEKYNKIVEKLPEIDSKIENVSKGWTIDRIGKVELSILRLATYEILFDEDIPVGVAIDEAVELAKRYGQDASPSFVNGILASIAK